ncbi:MAG: xanthine dehydrogenase family protein molybdopterin-binding subunit [Acidimicrobiia bacterium]|nr:xanthine dehydrogenase family protein molybdopterin-binding subunit [Acidimicrobiia bacterium]
MSTSRSTTGGTRGARPDTVELPDLQMPELTDYRLVGKAIPRVDGPAKVTGRATYGVDVQQPGMLVGRFLRAGIPHARIVDIDVSGAWEVPGVRAVVTGADDPRLHGPLLKDQPGIAREVVRWAGESVAAVAAEDEEAAAEALERIVVEYEDLPVVDTIDDALAPDAPLLHPDAAGYEVVETPGMRIAPVPGTNVPYEFHLRRGDVDAAFEEAAVVVEGTYETQFVQYCHLEPHVVIALFDAMGTLTLWTSTMGPHTLRSMIADYLGMNLSDVRVITNLVGGAYGAKMYVRTINPAAALLAQKVPGRPVRVVFDREDEFLTSTGRLPARVHIRTAADRDGRILARRSTVHWNKGAYADLGPMVCRNSGYVSLGPYRIPNASVDASLVYTNRQPGGAFRGLGVPQMAWAGEQQLDRLARELGVSPVELRRRNLLQEGDTSVTGEPMRQVGAGPCLEAVVEALEAKPPREPAPGRRVGRGVAVVLKSTLTPTATFATVRMNVDGSVDMICAAVEHGQGTMTALAQIVAEELQVPFERVRFVMPDTSVAPFDRSSSSSRTIFAMGNALRTAAIDIRTQLFELAARVLGVPADDLALVDGKVEAPGAAAGPFTVTEILRRHYKGPANIVGNGSFATHDVYDPMDPETGQSRRPSSYWMYAAAGAEVECDPETGETRVLRLITAIDAGKAVNPQGCRQQISGSAVMGLGMAMAEEVVFEEGRVMNPTFLDYKVPTSADIPEMEDIIVETAHELGPYGARGVGEPGTAAVPAAIGNAVYDAIGVQITSLPIRSEKVYRAVREASA